MTEKFEWHEREDEWGKCWYCFAKECVMYLVPRPAHCDRGRWMADVFDFGFPTNPKPFDAADLFPRYYVDLERGKQELADLLALREYTPTPPQWKTLGGTDSK